MHGVDDDGARSQPFLVSDTGWAYRKSEGTDLESGTSFEDLQIEFFEGLAMDYSPPYVDRTWLRALGIL